MLQVSVAYPTMHKALVFLYAVYTLYSVNSTLWYAQFSCLFIILLDFYCSVLKLI